MLCLICCFSGILLRLCSVIYVNITGYQVGDTGAQSGAGCPTMTMVETQPESNYTRTHDFTATTTTTTTTATTTTTTTIPPMV